MIESEIIDIKWDAIVIGTGMGGSVCGYELMERSKILKNLIKKILKKNFWVLFITGKNNLNWGHPSGTCRFGDSIENSVLDSKNCIHGVANVFVVDASFFPSSGGTNPSLTIAANAIRVSNIMNIYLEESVN